MGAQIVLQCGMRIPELIDISRSLRFNLIRMRMQNDIQKLSTKVTEEKSKISSSR